VGAAETGSPSSTRISVREPAAGAALTMLTTAALAAWAAATVALASPISGPSSSSADPLASILVLPRDGRPAGSVPSCATFHGTVGAQRLIDVYHVSTACSSSLVHDTSSRSTQPTPGEFAFESTDDFAQPTPGDSLSGALVWLHPTALEVDRPTSAAVDPADAAGQQQQLAFSAPSSSHPHLHGGITLPHGEGRLVRLSSTSDADALADLAHLSSHPAFALTSPVVISRAAVALGCPSTAGTAAVVDDRFPTVPRSAVERVEAHLAGLRFDPLLSSLVDKLGSANSVARIGHVVRTLSGEDQRELREDERVRQRLSLSLSVGEGLEQDRRLTLCNCSQWVSRHSMSEGGYKAANWVTGASLPFLPHSLSRTCRLARSLTLSRLSHAAKMSSYGFTCKQLSYLPELSPMVECVYDDSALGGDEDDLNGKAKDIVYGANETVVLSAHYDSRGVRPRLYSSSSSFVRKR